MFGKRVGIVGGDFRFKLISLRTIPPERYFNSPIEGGIPAFGFRVV